MLARPSPAALRAALPWLLAALGFAVDIAAFWPGQMSFDSAYAWWQVRHGETTDIGSPAMIQLWRVGNAIVEGPASMFVLHAAMFWIGLALFARSLRAGAAATAIVVLAIGFAPPIWLLRAHVWTDVGFLCALMLAVGCLAEATRTRGATGLAAAVPALVYAMALRHNALPAVLPLALWWSALALAWRSDAPGGARWTAALAAVFTAALVLAAAAANARVDRRVPLWPSLAQWDLAAISIAERRMLLPDFMIGPGLEIDELAAAFRPWSNVPMFLGTRHGLRDPFAGYTREELDALARAWLGAILAHPADWLRHRARLASALIGVHDAAWPRELIYVDDEVPYRDNPVVARNASPLHRLLMRAAGALAATPVLAGFPWLAAGVIAMPFAWRRRERAAARAALVLIASAWLYVAALIVLAPSAELRYLGWPMLASVLAVPLAWRARSAGAPDW